MAAPLYPNVPNAPGVPPVRRSAQFPVTATPPLAQADTPGLLPASTPPLWGIFKDGQSVVQADNVVSFDYKQDWDIADFPIEKGGFESYNKVNTPFSAVVSMSCGGSLQRRQAFLDSIDAIAGTTDLYDVVTPEKIFPSTNIQKLSTTRTSTNGATLIVVEIGVLQIRETANASFSSTTAAPQSPSSADPVNGGVVQPQPATPTQQSALSSISG